MNGSPGEGADSNATSDRPHEPEEEPLPGEDNPGERLIAKYDPTVDSSDPAEELKPETDDGDVPPETARLFWYLVTVFNVSILGLALGIMLIVFQDRWLLGGQITLAGGILLVYGLYRYRKYGRRDDESAN